MGSGKWEGPRVPHRQGPGSHTGPAQIERDSSAKSMLRSPLEQFIIIPLFSFQLGAIDLSFTNSALVFSLIGFTSYYLYLIISSGKRAVLSPTNYELALETYYDFVLNLTKENLGKNLKYFNFIFSLFSLIAFSNAFGFIPYVFCTTSHVIISLALSVSI